MNKKLMAVAVAGALAVPAIALADTANVQIYGRANLGLDQYTATGATSGAAADFKSRLRVYDSSSRLGFTGSEDLGGGLKAVFLTESGVNIDNGSTTGQNGLANVSSGTLSSRIGHVGLASSSAGQITFGRNNVWWANYGLEQTAANYVNSGISFFSGSLGAGMSVGVARVSNLMQYTSPTMSGVTAIVSYSPTSEAAVANAPTDGKLTGVTVQGQHGAFGWGFDWVKNTAQSPTPPTTFSSNINTGLKLRGGFRYAPGGQVSLIYVKSTIDRPAGAGAGTADPTATKLAQNAMGVNWEHVMGNIQFLAQYGKVNKVTGCAGTLCEGTTATAIMGGVRYLMSKRTAAYFTYNATSNGDKYNMDYTGSALTSATALAFGSDPKIIAVGVIHNF